MVDQWLVKLVKETFVMVTPVKAAGLGSYGFHTDYWNPGAVFAEFVQHLRGNQLFSLQSQCCLTDSGRPKHEDERIRLGSTDCIH
jgi:hypothetical protein